MSLQKRVKVLETENTVLIAANNVLRAKLGAHETSVGLPELPTPSKASSLSTADTLASDASDIKSPTSCNGEDTDGGAPGNEGIVEQYHSKHPAKLCCLRTGTPVVESAKASFDIMADKCRSVGESEGQLVRTRGRQPLPPLRGATLGAHAELEGRSEPPGFVASDAGRQPSPHSPRGVLLPKSSLTDYYIDMHRLRIATTTPRSNA